MILHHLKLHLKVHLKCLNFIYLVNPSLTQFNLIVNVLSILNNYVLNDFKAIINV